MQRLRRSFVAVLAALCGLTALVLAPAGEAADPDSGTVSAESPQTSWTGGPFLGINPTATTDCVVPQAPFCDVYSLTVGTLPADLPDVIVSVAMASDADLVNVAIFNAANEKVAGAKALGSKHTVSLSAPAAGVYSVRVELLLGIPGSSTYEGKASVGTASEPIDLEQDCLVEETPLALAADDGRIVDLDVLVLLDGVDQAFAERFFVDVGTPYEPLGIRVVPTFQVADPPFTGTATTDIISQARARFPEGKVPAEYDIVEVLTSKDLQIAGQNAVAGQADCLGGLAYDTRSYNVSEAPSGSDAGVAIGPLTFIPKAAAKITAHEMGHLLGGQHHYGNCAEGIQPEEELNGDTSPCSLMFNSADFISLKFSTLNARIARGYALRYASANDSVVTTPAADEPPAQEPAPEG